MTPQPRGRGPVHFNNGGGNYRRSYSPDRDYRRRSEPYSYDRRPRGRRSFPPGGPGKFGPRSSGPGYSGRTRGSGRPRVTLDRKRVCPLLLRLFPHDASVKREPEEYSQYCRVGQGGEALPAVQGTSKPTPEFRIYTWKDATLKELYELVQKTVRDESEENTQGLQVTDATTMSFALVYPDSRGRLVMRKIGTVSGTRSDGDERDSQETLEDVGFQIGDFVDVACTSSS